VAIGIHRASVDPVSLADRGTFPVRRGFPLAKELHRRYDDQ